MKPSRILDKVRDRHKEIAHTEGRLLDIHKDASHTADTAPFPFGGLPAAASESRCRDRL